MKQTYLICRIHQQEWRAYLPEIPNKKGKIVRIEIPLAAITIFLAHRFSKEPDT